MKILILLFFISFNIIAEEYIPTPIDNVQMECGKEVSHDVEWSYCISKTNNSNNQNILYHLHGRNGNATWWNDKTYHTGKIHKSWVEKDIDPPVVISISFGKVWFLLKNEDGTGLSDIFMQDVLRTVEAKLSFKPFSRSIMGISMGGLSTFYASMSNTSLFKKAVVLCAHIPFISHHDGFLKLMKYSFNHKVSMKRTYLMYKMSKLFFPTKNLYELNNPEKLLKSFLPEKSPSLYISCGKKDDWGCMKSSKMVVDSIVAKGGLVDWAPRNGGHCDLNHEEIADFLIN